MSTRLEKDANLPSFEMINSNYGEYTDMTNNAIAKVKNKVLLHNFRDVLVDQ